MKSYSLSRKMASYSVLASSLSAMSLAADAQILYTDVNPDETLFYCSEYPLDLNNDGNVDFRLIVGQHIFGYWAGAFIADDQEVTDNNFVAGIATGSSTYYTNGTASYIKLPFKLAAWQTIDSNTPWVKPVDIGQHNYCTGMGIDPGHQAAIHMWYSSELFGNWVDSSDGFMGLKIEADGKNYYGWVRLAVGTFGRGIMLIKDYAINLTPDAGILAGTITGISLPDAEPEIRIQPNPATDYLHVSIASRTDNSELLLFNAVGQQVSTPFSSTAEGWLINVQDLPAGTYLVEVQSNQKVMRKKIMVLH